MKNRKGEFLIYNYVLLHLSTVLSVQLAVDLHIFRHLITNDILVKAFVFVYQSESYNAKTTDDIHNISLHRNLHLFQII